ncbi:transcriptional repressor [Govanella unica]|uniref:Transcriptional repressor n=1 Tax=Govanella unica TaxID=2975056 RepID=A0A9X3Z7I9_9PROT|nr:transcriptional repressor [Govania unica]MDA5194295.1 transcriptional repressor [Govania unica]
MNDNGETKESQQHDHGLCVADAIHAAERICEKNGARLTDIRRHVLELVWTRHKPITAYEVLDLLKAERRNAAPPTVYRALDFLLEQRLIHRIESLNAFIGCASPDAAHRGGFFICSSCHGVEEIRDSELLRKAIRHEADEVDFTVTSTMIEIMGLCATCRGRA